MPTYIPKSADLDPKWYVIDANEQVLGKLAVTAARILTGKGKPIYTPFLDTGDHLIVVNAARITLTGKKLKGKLYRHHTGQPGGLKTATAEELLAKKPTKLVEEAVRGMLPKTKLGRAMLKKLKVYASADHPHAAQKPQAVNVK